MASAGPGRLGVHETCRLGVHARRRVKLGLLGRRGSTLGLDLSLGLMAYCVGPGPDLVRWALGPKKHFKSKTKN